MIGSFDGEFRFLSNFYDGDPTLATRLWGYPTTENYFQAMKTEDKELRQQFKVCTPGQSKRLGRKLKLREDWELIKDEVMMRGLERKFALGTHLADLLLDTGSIELVEGNTWHDNYWGNCTCDKCKNIQGNNNLGEMLMVHRLILRSDGEA